jgi:uncharacterized protein (DUF2336 family)
MSLWPVSGFSSTNKEKLPRPPETPEPETPEPATSEPPAEAGTAGRVRQAASPDSPPAVLHDLARDPDIIVRAAVAINSACGHEIDRMLAGDQDERVRALLGSRIARLLPGLDGDEHDNATRHVHTMLAALARDHATRVRAAIAHEIKSMIAAPHDLVLLLARDAAIEVSDPIVRLSPVLTDADLLALLATPPHPSAVESIASRPRLSAAVADAIAKHANAPAIRALLANPSASIKEATLDALVGRAAHHTEWHAPLVYRPHLSVRAVRALSQFIATDLLRVLAARIDLDQASRDAVCARVVAASARERDDESRVAELEQLRAINELTEDLLLETARAGDVRRLASLLAVASGVSLRTVDRVVSLRNAKALVSLTWRGGFSMRAGTAAQNVLGQLSPGRILLPTAEGGFPLSEDEMEWQIELMAEIRPDCDDEGVTWSGAA